jgi:hypothetical protein
MVLVNVSLSPSRLKPDSSFKWVTKAFFKICIIYDHFLDLIPCYITFAPERVFLNNRRINLTKIDAYQDMYIIHYSLIPNCSVWIIIKFHQWTQILKITKRRIQEKRSLHVQLWRATKINFLQTLEWKAQKNGGAVWNIDYKHISSYNHF